MFNSSTQIIIFFTILCTLLIATLIAFISIIVYRYQQKQNAYFKSMEKLKSAHANEMLQSQLEIQEQTFANISREIHDNIGQKLTLAKLHLNTLNLEEKGTAYIQLNDSVAMIGEAINDLSDISRSMSSDIILNNGFIQGLEFEVAQLNKSSLYAIELLVTGEPVFLESQKELVLFRIVQEALNNVMKHSNASAIEIELHYNAQWIRLCINDNGKGFVTGQNGKQGTGIANMTRRAALLNGKFEVSSRPEEGTKIKIEIPIHEN